MLKNIPRRTVGAVLVALLATLLPIAVLTATPAQAAEWCEDRVTSETRWDNEGSGWQVEGEYITVWTQVGYRHCSSSTTHRDKVLWVQGRYNVWGDHIECGADNSFNKFLGVAFDWTDDNMGGNNPPRFVVGCREDTTNSATYYLPDPGWVNSLEKSFHTTRAYVDVLESDQYNDDFQMKNLLG